MKSKTYLTLALSSLLLTACGGATSSPEPSSMPKTTSEGQPTTSSSSATPADDSSYSYVSADSDSGIGTRTNDEEYDYESIKVNKPAKALVDDFAFGADLSIIAEVERNGGVFYNEKGEEQDVFKLLAADGVNYCRLRLWNDPKSAVTGESYGGGGNDLETDIALAKRAKAAGMKVLLDFHYSDSWADPQKFHCPKAWADELSMDKPDLIADFTRDSLNAFKKAGIYVDSCQIGNETNYGIAGEKFLGGAETIVAMVRSGVAAAKEVFPNIKTLVHLTNIKSPKGVYNFLDAMEKGLDGENTPVPYDIVGLSYYPFWHGTQENLLNVMNYIRDTYDRPTWVVETSYGFTDEPNENCSNTYHSSTFETPGGYITSIQGQTTELADVVSTISSVNSIGNPLGFPSPVRPGRPRPVSSITTTAAMAPRSKSLAIPMPPAVPHGATKPGSPTPAKLSRALRPTSTSSRAIRPPRSTSSASARRKSTSTSTSSQARSPFLPTPSSSPTSTLFAAAKSAGRNPKSTPSSPAAMATMTSMAKSMGNTILSPMLKPRRTM